MSEAIKIENLENDTVLSAVEQLNEQTKNLLTFVPGGKFEEPLAVEDQVAMVEDPAVLAKRVANLKQDLEILHKKLASKEMTERDYPGVEAAIFFGNDKITRELVEGKEFELHQLQTQLPAQKKKKNKNNLLKRLSSFFSF